MMEEQLKRIADALEVIALSLQPTNQKDPAGIPATDAAPAPKTDKPAKKAKPAPTTAPAADPDPLRGGAPAYTTDEIVALVQKAVKVNRDATLEVCRKYGYQKSLKDIAEGQYNELAKELETVK